MKTNTETKLVDSNPFGSLKGSKPESRLILIVDNNSYSARLTSQQLRSMGFATEVTYSPSAALAMLKNGEVFPDLIFVEMFYHHENMFRFPEQVHEDDLWRSIPIMARSAPTTRQNIVRAIQSGYCDYILRPTEPDILREKIDKVFSTSTKVDTVTFALPVSTKGSVVADIDITAISEFGIEGCSEAPLKENTVIRLNSNFLNQFELANSFFRVTGCREEFKGSAERYKVALTFVALNFKSARLIRQYLVRQAKQVPRVA